MVSRAQRTPFGEWWWTVDRLTLAAIGALMLAGVVLSLAASPPVAGRLGLDPFYFVNRHILYLIPTVAIMLAVSFLNPRQIRRLALIVFAVILIAWLFGESAKRADMPANFFSLLLLLGVVALLVLQPDFGQTMLVVLVWSALFFMAGMRLIWVFGIAGIAGIGLTAAYFTVPHVASRIQKFLNPASGDTFNIDIATESFMRGGWFGRGPGEGTVKRLLPESHTDFVFAVAAEEFGVALCLALVALFAFIVIRALARAMRNDDAFTRFAAAGLAILFGIQSAINVAVNLHLIPAKGMTLPFISYGGSSMLSLAYAMGMLLALTREQPHAAMLTAPDPVLAGSAV